MAHGISWLDEVQQFYRERSAIEKEYSQKLTALARRYFEKKNKRSAALSVGDTPSMTPGSLERYARPHRQSMSGFLANLLCVRLQRIPDDMVNPAHDGRVESHRARQVRR